MLEPIAQAILDLYPDGISQFGLLGCAYFTLAPSLALWALWRLWRIATGHY